MDNSNYKKLYLLLILTAFLSGCAEESVITRPPQKMPVIKPKPIEKPQATDLFEKDVFIVKKGDTLYSIGFGSGYGYELLAEWNHIPKPYKLYVGQEIKLYDPNGELEIEPPTAIVSKTVIVAKKQTNKSVPEPSITTPKPAASNKVLVAKSVESSVVSVKKPVEANSQKSVTPIVETLEDSKDKEKVLKLFWKWPIQGKMLKSFIQTGNKGIDIEGKVGDPVHAAAKGEVVYSGNGLIGYGNLLIIKHNDAFLSAYANNASLMAIEGQHVTQGQVVARCGKSASGTPSLHFEIRKNGKSVNPLLYLPTQ